LKGKDLTTVQQIFDNEGIESAADLELVVLQGLDLWQLEGIDKVTAFGKAMMRKVAHGFLQVECKSIAFELPPQKKTMTDFQNDPQHPKSNFKMFKNGCTRSCPDPQNDVFSKESPSPPIP